MGLFQTQFKLDKYCTYVADTWRLQIAVWLVIRSAQTGTRCGHPWIDQHSEVFLLLYDL